MRRNIDFSASLGRLLIDDSGMTFYWIFLSFTGRGERYSSPHLKEIVISEESPLMKSGVKRGLITAKSVVCYVLFASFPLLLVVLDACLPSMAASH